MCVCVHVSVSESVPCLELNSTLKYTHTVIKSHNSSHVPCVVSF